MLAQVAFGFAVVLATASGALAATKTQIAPSHDVACTAQPALAHIGSHGLVASAKIRTDDESHLSTMAPVATVCVSGPTAPKRAPLGRGRRAGALEAS
jgi:hypothetical protein